MPCRLPLAAFLYYNKLQVYIYVIYHLWNRVDLNEAVRPKQAIYLLPQLVEDIGSGHNVVKTVFLECGWSFRKDGPREMKAVGEVEFCQKFHDQANILTNVNVNAGIAGRVSKISFPES